MTSFFRPALLAAAMTLAAHAQAQTPVQTPAQTPTRTQAAPDAHQAQKLAVVKKLYAAYRGGGPGGDMPEDGDALFSPDWLAVMAQEQQLAAQADGEGCLDYDFVIQGQDFDGAEITRTLQVAPAAQGRVRVSFRNFDTPVRLHYVLVCDGKGCLIDDIIEAEGSFKQRLRQCLKARHAQRKP